MFLEGGRLVGLVGWKERETRGSYIVGAAVAVGRLPELDVFAGERLDLACRVDDAGPRRAGADVDADVVVLGGMG